MSTKGTVASTASVFIAGAALSALLLSALIAWGIQPLFESVGIYLPFWPLFFTAFAIRVILTKPSEVNLTNE